MEDVKEMENDGVEPKEEVVEIKEALGTPLTAAEVAAIFSVNEAEVLEYYQDFGGVMITPKRYIFFKNRIMEKLGVMPTLDKRQVSGDRWKGVVQVNKVRKEQRFADDSEESYSEAVAWEEKMRDMLRMELATFIPPANTQGVAITPVKPETNTVSIGRFKEEYLDHCKERFAIKVVKEKEHCFRDFIAYFGDERPLDSITPSEANAFLQQIKKNGRSGNAANKIKKNITAGWNWGVTFINNFPTTPNPFTVVPKLAEVRHDRYVPPKEDFEKMVATLSGQDWVIFKTFYFTGARKSEVFKLKWEDVNFDKSTIRLWTRKRAGGNLEFDLIPMVSELKAILLDWREKQPVKSEYLFINMAVQSSGYGKPFVDRRRFLERSCIAAEVTPFGYHGIRHLTATELFHAGHPVSLIQRILRHKNPNTTARYLHALGLDNALEQIDGTF